MHHHLLQTIKLRMTNDRPLHLAFALLIFGVACLIRMSVSPPIMAVSTEREKGLNAGPEPASIVARSLQAYDGNTLNDDRCTSNIDTSKTYHIIARHSDKILGSSFSSNGVAPSVVQASDKSSKSTRWNLTPVAGSYYFHIVNEETESALNVKGASFAPGASVLQWPLADNAPGNYNDEWCFYAEEEDGYYQLVARHSNLVLDIDEKSCQEGAKSIQWYQKPGAQNQQFRLEEALVYSDYSTYGGVGVSIQEYERLLAELETCRGGETAPTTSENAEMLAPPSTAPSSPPSLEGECDETDESSQTTENDFDIGVGIKCTLDGFAQQICPASFEELPQDQQQRIDELFVDTYNRLAEPFCRNLTEATVTATGVPIVPSAAPSISSSPSLIPTMAPSGITPTTSPVPTAFTFPPTIKTDFVDDFSSFFGFTYKIQGTCRFCSGSSGGYFGNDGIRRALQSADGEECLCGAPSIQDFLTEYNQALASDDVIPALYYRIVFTAILGA